MLLVNVSIPRLMATLETSCAAGAPLRMKRGILGVVSSWREDVHQYTVSQRVFETVLWCLDEPLHVASPARAECESTKKILKQNRHRWEITTQTSRRKHAQEKGEVTMQFLYLLPTVCCGHTEWCARGA
jgi:hypothetical protein